LPCFFRLGAPGSLATSHEPLAVSQRCPSRPGLHLGVRTRSQRLVVLSPLPAVARFCRARPLTARYASSRPTHGASLALFRCDVQSVARRLPPKKYWSCV